MMSRLFWHWPFHPYCAAGCIVLFFCFFVNPGLMSLFFPASSCIEPSMFGLCSWSDRKYPSCNQTIARDRYWHNDLHSLLKRTETEWSTWPIVYRYTCSSPIICLFLFIAKVFYFLLFCFYNILTIGKLSDTLALFIP